jgi:broad specificity phosphatase PhoE
MWSSRILDWSELETRLRSRGKPFTLEVLRHGQTTANAKGLVSGTLDVPLTQFGERQAREAGAELAAHYDVAFHSPLTRSKRTLELAVASSGALVDSVIDDQRLSERSLGVLQGQLAVPIPAYDDGDLTYAPEGGEPYMRVAQRVLSFLVDLACMAESRPEHVRALVCTHVGPMRVLVAIATGVHDRRNVLTSHYANAEVYKFDVSELRWPAFLTPSRCERASLDE